MGNTLQSFDRSYWASENLMAGYTLSFTQWYLKYNSAVM